MAKILIVDDERSIRTTLSAFLTFEGYDVETAEDVDEAYERLGKGRFDIVISDIMMPELDGLELCRRIKGNYITSHIPVIILTAKASQESTGVRP